MKWKVSAAWGTRLLAVFLVLFGLSAFGPPFPYFSHVLGALAIAAGVLLLFDR